MSLSIVSAFSVSAPSLPERRGLPVRVGGDEASASFVDFERPRRASSTAVLDSAPLTRPAQSAPPRTATAALLYRLAPLAEFMGAR